MHYYRTKPFNPKGKHHVRHENIGERLSALLQDEVHFLSDWEKKYLSSSLRRFTTHKCITRNQYKVLCRVESAIAERKDKNKSLLDNKQYCKLVDVLMSEEVTKQHAEILASLKHQWQRKGELSEKQFNLLDKICKSYTDDALAKRALWKKEYLSDSLKQQIFETCCDVIYNYWHGRYFQHVVTTYIGDKIAGKKYIPTEATYNKITSSKLTKNIVDGILNGGRWNVGDLVKKNSYNQNLIPVNTPLLIVGILPIKNTCKGCFAYEVVKVDDHSKKFRLEERNLKRY